MLKKRVIANVIIKENIAVQSINFKNFLPIGSPIIAIEFLNKWGIDEIILLDIMASSKSQNPNYELVKEISKKCFVPITIGGGITNINQISRLMQCGADKISLNQSAICQQDLITSAAKIFGNQCIVVSIDAIKIDGEYKVYDYINKSPLNLCPSELALRAEMLGAGEILINSVDKDGSYLGYDIELINSVCDVVDLPVICSGGAKNANDFIDVFNKTKVSAAAAANFFHFTEHSVNITKQIISKEINLRIESHANYDDSFFDQNLRLFKKDDFLLEKMLFTRIEKEII